MFIYYLVSIETIIFCSLWITTPPTLDLWIQSCPSFNFGWGGLPPISGLADIDTYIFITATDLETGMIVCTVPAFHNFTGPPCSDLGRLDQYRLDLIHLNAANILCTVYSNGPPDITQCNIDTKGLTIEWRGPYEIKPPTAGPDLIIIPPRPDLTRSIITDYNLEHLNYWLRWYDLGDSYTWQNQFNDNVLAASVLTNVPPDILKSVIGQESQFWPGWTGIHGEVGLIQLTYDGADLALRYSPYLFNKYCQMAAYYYYCLNGYDLLPPGYKYLVQSAMVSDLILDGSIPDRVKQIKYDLVTYGHILAAYYSYAAALGYEGWNYALAAYNAGGSCIITGTICPDGDKYLSKVYK